MPTLKQQLESKINALRARLHTSKTIYTIMQANLENAHNENWQLREENERLTIELLAATKVIKRIKAQYIQVAGELAKVEPWWRELDDELGRMEVEENMPEHSIPSFPQYDGDDFDDKGKPKRVEDLDLDDIPF